MTHRPQAALAVALAIFAASSVSLAQRRVPVQLSAGFLPDPRQYQGASGGQDQASNLGGQCRGWIDSDPNWVVMTSTGFRFLRVYVESTSDTTLVIRNGTQVWCADDTYGLNPGLDLQNVPPGRLEIFVGSYGEGDTSPVTLTLTESVTTVPGNAPPPQPVPVPPPDPNAGNNPPPPTGPGMALHTNLPPVFGRVAITGPLLAPRLSTAHTSGNIDARGVHGQGVCTGFITDAPSYVLTLTQAHQFLRAFVTSAADTTLLIQFPDGHVMCSDDSFNTPHPSIDGAFAPGTYFVWVGIYRTGMNRPFRLTITSNADQHP